MGSIAKGAILSSKTLLTILLAFTATAQAGEEVNVYSHRHYPVDRMLFEQFTEQSGIRVNVVKASADQLIKRLEIEGDQSPADVLITVDAGRLFRAQSKGLLQPVKSRRLMEQVPAHLRDPGHHWFGLTMRARAIVYARDRVTPEQLSTYEALAEPQWKGKVLIRSAQNIYNQSLMASMIVAHGEAEARIWAQGMVRNFARAPKGNDRDQVKAIAIGIGDVAIVNSYYIGKLFNSEDEAERLAAAAVKLFFPNQDDRGTHINISGAGVTASSNNVANAIKLLEFLSGPQAQQAFAIANFEYPVNPTVEASSLKMMWGEFKTDTINLSLLGKHNFEAVTILAESGWR